MSRVMRVVVATSLALAAFPPAWAGEEESDEAIGDTPVASATVARAATIPSGNVDFLTFDEPVTPSGSGGLVEIVAGSGRPTVSTNVKASAADARWLREREGYRDGGY